MKAEEIAEICHEANRTLQKLLGEEMSPAWGDATQEMRNSAVDGVRNVVENDATPRESHENWVTFKMENGWAWGPEKDEEKKTHPCLVMYDELDDAQKLKDKLFVSIVDAMTTEEVESEPDDQTIVDTTSSVINGLLGMFTTASVGEEHQVPTPGRIVWYQVDGRNGLDYYLPAMVTVTKDSHPGDYPDGKPNSLPVPSSAMHVHLTVYTPGGFGSTYSTEKDGTNWEWDYEHEYKERMGKPDSFTPGSGTYVEHDVLFDPQGSRRSWRWPERS